MIVTIWKRSDKETDPPRSLNLVKGNYAFNFVLAIPKLLKKTPRDIEDYLDQHTKAHEIMGKVVDIQSFDVYPVQASEVPAVKRYFLGRLLGTPDYFKVVAAVEVISNPLPVVIAVGAIIGILAVFGFLSFLSIERTVRFGKPLIAIPIAIGLILMIIVFGPVLSRGPKVAAA